jgi:hypothetical protein
LFESEEKQVHSESISKLLASLDARVTALTTLVESLLAQDLGRDENPRLIGESIVKHIIATEQAARDQIGATAHIMAISENVTSLVDRAVLRAERLQSKRRDSL